MYAMRYSFQKGNENWKLRNQAKANKKIAEAMRSPEVKEKLRAKSEELWADPEWRSKKIASMQGRKRSAESKIKQSETLKKRWAEKGAPNTGRKWSEEVNKKKGRWGKENVMSRPRVRAKHKQICNTPEMKLKRSLANRGENNWNWRGGYTPYYGDNWKYVRERSKERDNYECKICESEAQLVSHHIIPFKEGGENKLDNLITLCRSCHMRVEAYIKNEQKANTLA